MLFFGHIAIAAGLADATASDAGAAIAGNLVPDVIDKTGAWVFRVMPSGRWLAHGLPFVALACGIAGATLPRRKARGFALGYLSHLAADHWAGGRLPWLAPFTKPPAGRSRHDAAWLLKNLLPEAAGAVFLLLRKRRRGRAPAA